MTYKVGSNTAQLITDPGTGQAIMLATPSHVDGLYVYDGYGNPVGIVVDSGSAYGEQYDPYGVPTVTYDGGGDGLSSNPYAFKGGTISQAVGIVKFGLRWYDHYTGAWMQQDTLDAPLDPSNANRYAYAGDDPINNTDLMGELTIHSVSPGFSSVYFNRTETMNLANGRIDAAIVGGFGGAAVIIHDDTGSLVSLALGALLSSLFIDAGIAHARGECARANFVPGGYYPSVGQC